MGLANIDSGLDDDQIQSLVHQLRHEFTDHPRPGPVDGSAAAVVVDQRGAWDRFRATTATRITAHPGLRPQRRAGLLRRITQADAIPPADMVYAAQHIRDRAIRAARLVDDHLATEAARIAVPDHDALATYEQGRRNAPTGRQARATDEQRRAWPGLPLDPRTRHGLAALAARPDSPDGRHELITAHDRVRAENSTVVDAVGYHPDSGRLEVLTPDRAVLTYRRIPPVLAEQLHTGENPDRIFRDRIQGNPAFQYRDAVQAAAAGVRRRCPDCGQFTGATHSCLGRRGGIRDGALGSVTPLVPARRQITDLPGTDGQIIGVHTAPLPEVVGRLEGDRDDAVEFLIAGTVPDTGGTRHVSGDLVVALDADDHVSVSSARLACTCDGYLAGQGCSHVQQVASGLRTALVEQLVASRNQVAAATAAAISAPATGGASTQPVTDTLLPGSPNISTFSYSQDPARFADDVRAAWARPAETPVPWIQGTDQSPVLYGYGADREFGVELEFDAAYTPATVVRDVAQNLYARNFTSSNRQHGYHAGLSAGYQRNLLGGWTYERDCTVSGGELVSPIMSDTPPTWERLDEVCGLITDNGGRPSSATGSHVTVSAPEQAGMAKRLTRFLRLMHHHQPDLHLMAAAGRQRGPRYASPMPTPPDQGYTSIGHAQRSISRGQFANITHIAPSTSSSGAMSSRVEFRLWDGSLEPGRIQAQIRMSTALLDYSARNRGLTIDTAQRAGPVTLNPDHADFADHTDQVRGLIDHLFRRDEEKRQVAALWAAGLRARGYTRSHLI
ncbi:MAG TPA: amidoligase family protein [Nakamurella sp.]